MLQFHCPSCKRSLTAPEDKAGRTFPCPACKTPVKVPLLLNPPDDESYDFTSLLDEENPPIADRRAKKSKLKSIEVETEPCRHCGVTTIFPASVAGQLGECSNCGQKIVIPTVKQHEYRVRERKSSLRAWGCVATLIAFPTLIIVLVLTLSNYRRSNTPLGAATNAWHERNKGGLGPYTSVDGAYTVASEGQISIIRISSSIGENGRKRLERQGLHNLAGIHGSDVEYFVMRGLEVVEVVADEADALEKLKKKYTPNKLEIPE